MLVSLMLVVFIKAKRDLFEAKWDMWICILLRFIVNVSKIKRNISLF